MKNKGQTTVEFLIVFLLLLTIYQLVVLPEANIAIHSVRDIERISKARMEAEKLKLVVEKIAFVPGSSRVKLNVFLEPGSILRCVESTPNTFIEYSVDISDNPNANLENLPTLLKSRLCFEDEDGKDTACTGRIVLDNEVFQCNFEIEGEVTPKSEIEVTKIAGGKIYASFLG